MLVLAVHSVEQVTAKVAFSTILLQDFVSSKKVPSNLKCRGLIPTSGAKSISLWDVDEPKELLDWLNENIGVDCEHEVYEVQEDFAMGLGEVHRARAAERVASGTKDIARGAAKAVGAAANVTVTSVQDFDHKMRISERTASAVGAVRESTVVQNTAAVLSRAGTSVRNATTKVLEQPAVTSATEAMSSSMKKFGESFTSFTERVMQRKGSASSGMATSEAVDLNEETYAPKPTEFSHP